jgi:UDP-glucose 4-epimerase
MYMKTVLLTGGLGFIGSHIAVEMLNNNYNVIIIDNLSNSSIDKFDVIKKYSTNKNIQLYLFDVGDYEKLLNVFKNIENKIDLVVHLAGFKAVSESINLPIKYYQNNLCSTLNLVKVMEECNCFNLIFSSSSTVYGNSQVPYFENSQTGINITNPYGKSKHIQEEILKDLYLSNDLWNITILRYFNPICHLNHEFKENPNGIPNNLFPYIVKVYNNSLPILNIFGNDYDTIDGTCERDFIHVVDLANAHYVSSNYMIHNNNKGIHIYNIGTGIKVTVLELINAFEKENNTKINYVFTQRRNGDLQSSYANVSLIYKEIGWKSRYNINDCVKL